MKLHDYILDCGHIRGITKTLNKGDSLQCFECQRTPRRDSPAPSRTILAIAPEVPFARR